MRKASIQIFIVLKLKEAGDKNGVALPGQEETRLATNFIR